MAAVGQREHDIWLGTGAPCGACRSSRGLLHTHAPPKREDRGGPPPAGAHFAVEPLPVRGAQSDGGPSRAAAVAGLACGNPLCLELRHRSRWPGHRPAQSPPRPPADRSAQAAVTALSPTRLAHSPFSPFTRTPSLSGPAKLSRDPSLAHAAPSARNAPLPLRAAGTPTYSSRRSSPVSSSPEPSQIPRR